MSKSTTTLAPAALERCLEGITYPMDREVRSWSSQISDSIKRALRRRAAEHFARRYFAEHGRLPEGLYHIVVTVGPGRDRGDADIAHPFNRGLVHSSERVLEADIIYPAL